MFPSTGLWPVIWSWPGDSPNSYLPGKGDPSRADSVSAAAVLRRAWPAEEGPFPGLADAASDDRLDVQPFDREIEDKLVDPAPSGGRLLMLVPVNRPADVYSALGGSPTEYFSDRELTAVLRSWEERFGAVITALTPSTVELAVGAPPRDRHQADRLAAEQLALMPDEVPEDLRDLPHQLRSTRGGRGSTSARYWLIGWAD